MSRGFVWALASGLALASVTSAPAADLHFELLNGLRKQGYGDMAVNYLRNIEQAQKIPDDLKETFDLELARSMQVAAQFSENVDEAERLRLETRAQLDKFLKEHPTHAEAALAYDTYGVLSLGIGNSAIKQSAIQKDPARKAELLAQAKAAFEEARPRFAEAAKQFQAKYEALKKAAQEEQPSRVKKSAKRLVNDLLLAEDDWVNSRFNLAMIDYHVARTYPDLKQPEAKALLQKADKALDVIWHAYSDQPPGLPAHHWTARINEELGNHQKAIDIYDEVTANEPEEGREISPYMMQFFAENFLYRTRLQAKLGKFDDLILEAEDWLDRNSARKCDAYYGVMLEVAQVHVANAEKLPDEGEKKKLLSKVMRTLRDVKNANSSYQSDILLLLRKYSSAAGEESMEAGTFDEAVALADVAIENQEYAEAAKLFGRALELKDQEKNQDRLQQVEYFLAQTQLQAGDAAASFALANQFAREKKEAKLAPQAAVLAINAALSLCATSTDRPAAEKQLNDVVDYTIQTWPNRAEADDARIALGRLKMTQGDLPAAIAALEKVNPASDRYAQTQSLIGQSHWRIYLNAKRTGKVDDAAKDHRTKGQALMEQALAAVSKSTTPADEYVASESRLHLGELFLEGAQPDQAIAMLAPLESKIRTASPASLDITQLRTLVAAVGAHVAKKDMVSAKASGDLLLLSGQDIPPVNTVLSNIARQLREGYKAELAKVQEAENGSIEQITAAREAVDRSKAAIDEFLGKLITRQQLSLPELIAIGDGAGEIGNSVLAKQAYQRVLDTGNALPEKTPQVQAALIRVQSAFVGLLRASGEYEEAMKQVEELIQSAPKALDPQIERARILQGMAEKSETPDPAKWAAATKAWSDLRVMYSRATKKPPVYYEVVLNAATCLAGQARTAANEAAGSEFRKQALSLLKSTMALAPALSGPDMVANYTSLIEELK
jgi:hypothetical protein